MLVRDLIDKLSLFNQEDDVFVSVGIIDDSGDLLDVVPVVIDSIDDENDGCVDMLVFINKTFVEV